MTNIDVKAWSAARRALERAVALYLDDPNVSLVDLGFRTRSTASLRLEPELVVRVHVRCKLHGDAFHEFAAAEPNRVIAAQRLGFAVDVLEADYRLHLQQEAPVACKQSDSLTPRLTNSDDGCGINNATGVAIPQLGMRVIKAGGHTGVTSGIVTGVLGYSLQRDGGVKRLLGPLVHITPEAPGEKICELGDAGAWWLEASTRRALALHFAGSDDPSFALAFSMPEVLKAPEANIVTTPTTPANEKGFAVWQTFEELGHATKAHVTKTIPTAIRSFVVNPTTRQVYRIVRAGLLLTLGMAIVGFYNHLRQVHRQQPERIAQLQRRLQCLKTIAQVDSMRQQQIQKIVAIIDRFNRGMEAELKFRLAEEIYEMSLKYRQLDVDLICATITHETGRTWNPQAVSRAGALGLMQILPTTAINLAQAEGLTWTSAEAVLFDPIYNVRLGCRFLAELISNYGVEAGLAAYNGGDRQAKLWLQGGRDNNLLPAETVFYVPAVLRLYQEYRRMTM